MSLLPLVVVAAASGFLPPPPAHAMSRPPAVPDTIAADPLLRGTLHLTGEPADSGTVVLHRVTPAEAGAVDSVRVDGGGGFELRLPAVPVPGSGELFFASHRYEDILYFGPPINDPAQLDSLYRVEAYRTREPPEGGGGLPFTIAVRNLFIDQGPMGWRVTDLMEIRNDSTVTWVPGEADRPVWRYPLPPEALSPRVGQSELAGDAVRFTGGEIAVHAPVPPGERLYVVQYEVSSLEFSLPLPGRTEILEVLVEEPAPALRMDGLVADRPAELEPGRTYLRWTGVEVQGMVVRVRRAEEGTTELLPWLGIGLALLLLGAGIWTVRPDGPRGLARARADAPRRRNEILLEIARLDEEFERSGAPGDTPRDDVAASYRDRRRALLDRLGELDRTEP